MALGGGRAAAGDLQGAAGYFDQALRAHPGDAAAWAELGYAALQTGQSPLVPLTHARALTHDRTLLAQIWFNEALFREKTGDAEASRAALVAAEANGSKAAAQRLGTASRCGATWKVPEKAEALAILGSWSEVLSALGLRCLADDSSVATEAAAKSVACAGCIDASQPGAGSCTGPGPWTVPTGATSTTASGRAMLLQVSRTVQPLPGGRFCIDCGRVVRESGESLVSETLAPLDWVTLPEEGAPVLRDDGAWSDDAPPDSGDDGGLHCRPDVQGAGFGSCGGMGCGGIDKSFPPAAPTELRYYTRAGKPRLVLTVYSGDVKATLHGDTAKVNGGGCDATVALGPAGGK